MTEPEAHSGATQPTLLDLAVRRDGPAAQHLAIQIAATLLFAGLTLWLAEHDHPAQMLSVFALAVAVLSYFPLLHECGHQTAFATRWANEFGVWLGALFMLQAPSFFREFHWAHHRETQRPETDPEISGAPAMLDGFPRNPFTYAFLVSGQFLMVGKLGFTIACALLPRFVIARLFPFIRANRMTRIANESRFALMLFVSAGLGAYLYLPHFERILIAWPVAHLILGFYLMPEHTGLPNDGDQIHRTRTVRTNRFVRAVMWNMPLHAEHHAHPGVPYHALPALHAWLEPRLEHVSSGYLAFHVDAAARALRLR